MSYPFLPQYHVRGLIGYGASALFRVGAPKNTPKQIVEQLNREINAILAEPDMTKRLVELGGAETEKWNESGGIRRP